MLSEKVRDVIVETLGCEAEAVTPRDALCAAGCAVMGLWTLWDVPCTYPLFERMKLEIAACGGVVRDAEYGADIVLRAAFPARNCTP